MANIRYIDLFCGVGGFRYAMMTALKDSSAKGTCVFSSDIDKACQDVYAANFGERPTGDITSVNPKDIPDHDIMLAGFPCQPFSIIGNRKGFEDTRGTLFFNIASILEAKRPRAFILENVKLLKGHNSGKTLVRIMDTLRGLGYRAEHHVMNALNFGLPQKRERIFIVGFREKHEFSWPHPDMKMKPLASILEKEVDSFYFVSSRIHDKRMLSINSSEVVSPGIWHENKAGHISVYPYSCTIRAGASYNYLLVDGTRRLTGREMFRLQGFPDSFKLPDSYGVARKQAGNSLPIPVATSVIKNVLSALEKNEEKYHIESGQTLLFAEKGVKYGKPIKRSQAENCRKISPTL